MKHLYYIAWSYYASRGGSVRGVCSGTFYVRAKTPDDAKGQFRILCPELVIDEAGKSDRQDRAPSPGWYIQQTLERLQIRKPTPVKSKPLPPKPPKPSSHANATA